MSLEMLALGTSFLSGLMGMGSDRSARRQQQRQFQQQQAMAQAQFDAQMDQSVSRRVADAKSAGIHPLFALGGSMGASPTLTAGTPPAPRRSNSMGNAVGQMAAQLGMMESNKASAQRDVAQAMLYDSQRARIEQDLNGRGHDSPPAADIISDNKMELGPATFYSPEVPFSSRPGVRSGPIPEKIDTVLADGRTLSILNPDLNLDEISQVDYVVKKVRLSTTDAIEDIANWVKEDSPSNSQLRMMERLLKKEKSDPGFIDRTYAQWRAAFNKVKQTVRKYSK